MQRRLFAVAAMTATMMFAQGRGPGRPDGHGTGTPNPPDAATRIQWRVERLTQALTLNETQKTNATKIFTEADAASTNARTAVQTAMDSMKAAVKSNDTTAIDRLATQLGQLHAQLIGIESRAHAAFYALLNAEQKAKFDEMGAGRGMGPGRMGGGMGPGGMGPGGMGPQGMPGPRR